VSIESSSDHDHLADASGNFQQGLCSSNTALTHAQLVDASIILQQQCQHVCQDLRPDLLVKMTNTE
jgi:hypothetical protein